MELRARTSTLPRRAVTMTALAALIASAFAGVAASPAAAAKKKKVKAPVVTKVSPLDVAVGETLTIRGRNFLRGRYKNKVAFKRPGARAVWVKADLGTTKLLKVTIPASLQEVFQTLNQVPQPTRFQIRVLTKKLGKKYTTKRNSPVVSAPRPATPPKSQADGDCNGDGIKNSATSDDDGDLLPDTLEAQLNTDPCNPDTDGDGVSDGYEYKSALDLNDDDFQQPNADIFYPAKLPYPNPLYAGDANTDFDGDSLTLTEEYKLWQHSYSVAHTDAYTLYPLSYSDGEQYSRSTRVDGRRVPTLTPALDEKWPQFVAWTKANGYFNVKLREHWYLPGERNWTQYSLFDADRDPTNPDEITGLDRARDGLPPDGFLSDDERDEDADGLSNYDELHGRMTPGYWNGCYDKEKPFHIRYAGTSAFDPDTDRDGIVDGADDQDHDDIPNIMELSRGAAGAGRDAGPLECKPSAIASPKDHLVKGRVNPFNPCLPDMYSRTCPIVVDENTGAPFDGTIDSWLSLQ